jgi:hypothetical protein
MADTQADIETRIADTLRVVREAIRTVEADPDLFRNVAARTAEETSGGSALAPPAETPDVALRKIERILSSTLDCLQSSPSSVRQD